MHAIRLMKKARQCELKSTIEAKLYYFLISPTDDDYAVSLVFTQRFSVGHLWSHFCNLPYVNSHSTSRKAGLFL